MHHLYFMGIGGTAMGSVAILLQQYGYRISGSDQNLYPPMSTRLREAGITAHEGYTPEHLRQDIPDLVVVGNVIGRGNPEAEWLLEHRNIPFVSLPELIRSHLLKQRPTIVVAGTHGKTTTTALTLHLLKAQGLDPGYLFAGVPMDGCPSASFGSASAPFVIEGDEYDSAFFDKRSKFIHYFPNILIINNLEFDHGDIFRDLEDIERTFQHLVRIVPGNGHILVNGDDERLLAWVEATACCEVWPVGTAPHNRLRIQAFREDARGSQFELFLNGQLWSGITWSHAAEYNARNAAMAALAASLQTQPDNFTAPAPGAFESFAGIQRRQQMLLSTPDWLLIEDFGHHPTAVRDTLLSLRARFPGHRLLTCFEPRSNTSTLSLFQERWLDSLSVADACWIAPVHRAHLILPERRLDTLRLAHGISSIPGKAAWAFDSHEALKNHLFAHVRKESPGAPSLLVFFTNGAFNGLIDQSQKELLHGQSHS